MKKVLITAAVAALILVLVPVAVCGAPKKNGGPSQESESTQQNAAQDSRTNDEEESIAVFLPDAGQTSVLTMEDYVIGAVAAEMPAAYEEEALKAQAAACVTLARYMQRSNRDKKDLNGAVIAADAKKYQGYMTVEEMRSRWGDDFDACYRKIKSAVEAVLPYTVCYDGEPILAAFHAVSSGLTEDAETLWGKKVAYLVNTESEGDRLCPGYASSLTVSPEEFREKIGFQTEEADPAKWIGEGEYSKAGTLLKLQTGDKTVSGETLRDLFGLRSNAVKVRFDGGDFVLDVTGYGHGVGMSQYGADYYARQGLTWREILAHYYPGTEIS
ncbi:MAG: stage II sporulation protein D [Clostridia bacterium]|nr:stage II sporulation protein D [Clostridia bacterium]